MPGEQHGEAMPLSWDDRPDAYLVRGHVTDAEFVAAWDAHEHEPGWTAVHCDLPSRHAWARNEMAGYRDFGSGQVVAVHETKGRGCYPVTVADATPWREVDRRLAAALHTSTPETP